MMMIMMATQVPRMDSNLPLDARDRVFSAADQIFDESGRQTLPTID